MAPTALPDKAGRLLSIDVYRGLTVGLMILVTNPGSYATIYSPLKHAEWNGATPTDMVFPSFLFLIGVSIVYSFAARHARGETTAQIAGHIAVRALLLTALGLLVNSLELIHLTELRVPGILQHIALCYLACGFLYLWLMGRPFGVRAGGAALAAVAVLAIDWALLKRMPVPGYGVGSMSVEGHFGAYLDRAVFTTQHLWHWGGQRFDPDGLLVSFSSTVNLLLGIVAGEWLRLQRRGWRSVLGMAALGAVLIPIGFALDPLMPINKKIWTPSFDLLSGGVSLMVMAGLHAGIDRWKWRRGLTPLLVLGTNAILAFVLASVLGAVAGLIVVQGPRWKLYGTSGIVYEFLLPWMSGCNASLVYALLFLAVHVGIVWLFYRRRVFLKL